MRHVMSCQERWKDLNKKLMMLFAEMRRKDKENKKHMKIKFNILKILIKITKMNWKHSYLHPRNDKIMSGSFI